MSSTRCAATSHGPPALVRPSINGVLVVACTWAQVEPGASLASSKGDAAVATESDVACHAEETTQAAAVKAVQAPPSEAVAEQPSHVE